MPIKVTCTNCGGVLHAPDDAGGKRGRCPTCGNILPIPAVAGGGDLPDPPPAPHGQRPPSFADFAMGPQVGPPPGSGSAEAPRGAAQARSSIPFNSGADPAPPQRAKPPAEPAAAPRAPDPFARKGKPAPVPKAAGTVAPTEGTVKAWKRSRGGLAWVQCANFLLFIPAVLLPGYYVADAVMKATSTAEVKTDLIPFKDPGYLGISGLNSNAELPLLAGGAPVVLALLLNVFGRLGFSGAPKRSAVGGPAMLSALSSLWVLGAAVAVALPPALTVFDPQIDPKIIGLFDHDNYQGLVQRIAIFSGLAALVVGEFWFASAIGRVGSALADGKPAGRSTRFMMLLGVVIVGLVGTAALAPSQQFGLWSPRYDSHNTTGEFPNYSGRKAVVKNPAYEAGRETNELVAGQWEKYVSPQFELAGSYKPVIVPGLFLLCGLIVWMMHLRMVGAARGAMAGWLDAHAGG